MSNPIADLQVLEDLSLITDIVIDEPADPTQPTDVAYARAFTGEAQPYWLIDPANHSKEGMERIKWLYDFYGALQDKGPTEPNFRFSHAGYTFRGNRKAQFDGERTLSLRRIPEVAPDLSDLSFPPYYGDFLMLPDLLETGGLVLVTAPVGQGKTTTISAALKSRSKRYGGVTAMVEDPNELKISCGHTTVRPSKAWGRYSDTVRLGKMFPLSMKVWYGTMMVNANLNRRDSILKRGTVITKINGKTADAVVDRCLTIFQQMATTVHINTSH